MRYSGQIGYSVLTEVSPGVWDDIIEERDYIGDLVQRTERLSTDNTVNPEYQTTTSISVISDGVDKPEYFDIRYITFNGTRWAVTSVQLQPPRLVMFVGGVYNGPTATST
ncbi:hypothetical protein EKK58_11940 [Candidatus Dependentiae bacterium]|nr:MAG: hypothetical protein EKK58_11940 [Candidatus Dependentiae bacterium]